jgi:uncharacterized protein YcbX
LILDERRTSMPILSELVIYPIKSCAGLSVRQATLSASGLAVGAVRDRAWMVVDADGLFLTQREYPCMALIAPRLNGAMLELTAPGMAPLEIAVEPVALAKAPTPALQADSFSISGALPATDPNPGRIVDSNPNPNPERVPTRAVRIWDDDVKAIDCGDAAADWFSQVLGAPCRLVRAHPDAGRLASAKWTGGVAAPTLFADGFPLLVIGAASLTDLNDKLVAAGRAALPMNRFRPNLVIDGIDAFEEDYVGAFQIGAAELTPVKPCPRCPIPSVDQASGVAGPDPLDIMQAYRRKARLDDAVCFGMNCIVSVGAGAQLCVGQDVGVTLAF